jgi:hypothetical protein
MFQLVEKLLAILWSIPPDFGKTSVSNPVRGPVVAQRGVEVELYSSNTSALEGGEWSVARPGRFSPPGKTRYPLYGRLGGLQGRSRRAENLAPTGIRSLDHPARRQSLYRLSYPAQKNIRSVPNISTGLAKYLQYSEQSHRFDRVSPKFWRVPPFGRIFPTIQIVPAIDRIYP